MRLALILLLMFAQITRSEELSVAAAADLIYCLPQINAAFQKTNPSVDIKVSYGSSGNFFEEIRSGAPFDVFLSADMGYPKSLAKDGFAEAPVKYAEGRLVLWTMNGALDLSRGLAALRDAAVHRVALANPDHAPYGRAAKAALTHEHLWEELAPKFVFGESIAQTAQFVQTDNADAGLVAMSLVAGQPAARAGHYFEIPADDYPALEPAAAVTKSAEEKPLARAYVEFLNSAEAQKIMAEFGFRLPK